MCGNCERVVRRWFRISGKRIWGDTTGGLLNADSNISPDNGQVVGGAPFTGYTFSVGIVKVQAVKALWESMI